MTDKEVLIEMLHRCGLQYKTYSPGMFAGGNKIRCENAVFHFDAMDNLKDINS